ncbi:hypothetical protein [uncultured Microbacterium sp.]|uniref:hypothetical protein n=1 Tax=uncultured Microbacterium sp. TaxID=191216 RepID=UPI0025FB9FD1|nr:hypothetical protein [uncultured Microbacterium sp.]
MGGTPVIEWLRPGVGYEPAAAASMRRLEKRLGREHDCNSSYRDYSEQKRMFDAWTRYVNSGYDLRYKPNHSRALNPDDSMHCRGLADDSDDWTTPGYIDLAAEYGWVRTAAWDPTERHHFEYQWRKDQHRDDPDPRKDFLMSLSDDEQRALFDRTSQIHSWLDAVQQALLNGRAETGWGERAIDTIHRVSLDHYNRIFVRNEDGTPAWDFYQEALPALRRIENVTDEEVERLAKAFADESDRRRAAAKTP